MQLPVERQQFAAVTWLNTLHVLCNLPPQLHITHGVVVPLVLGHDVDVS